MFLERAMKSWITSNPNSKFLDQAFVSTQDIYTIYNIPASYIRRQVEAGNFPQPMRMGGIRSRMFFKYTDVKAYFDNNMSISKEDIEK